jgi:menaquinone-specific isochorismate synthase
MTRVNNVAYSKLSANMYNVVEEGKRQALLYGKQVLVSSVFAIGTTDLPAFFTYNNGAYRGNRFYWSEPGRALTYVGLGSVFTIEENNQYDRFRNVDEMWRQLASSSIVEGNSSPYTGPILFGGFSFDPHIVQSHKWSDFSHTSFAVPKYMVTAYGGKFYLTSNRLIDANDEYNYEDEDEELTNVLGFLQSGQSYHEAVSSEKECPVRYEEIAPSDWMNAVEEAALSIRQGELEKVVLARTLMLQGEDAFSSEPILRSLLEEQLNTYVFAIDKENSCFIGATPERLIKHQAQQLQTLSLAGSIARGNHTMEDDELASFLSNDVKNLHEHKLAVDMIKSAMQELCEQVDAPDTPIIRKLKDIQHLATPITGIVKEGVTLLQAVEALHPTPALGGMPRESAIDAIRRLEHMDRGWYAAPIGWMNISLEGEFAAAIRSALLVQEKAYLFAGCGIVGDSDPLSEYKETALKFRPMLKALQAALDFVEPTL